jgi:hypothetical protein
MTMSIVLAFSAAHATPIWEAKTFLTEPLADATSAAPLVLEAVVVSTEPSIWLGPAGDSPGTKIRLTVSRMLKGSIASGHVDLWDANGIGHLTEGQRLLIFAGPKVMQFSDYGRSSQWPFDTIPYYEDTIVPLWDTSIVRDSSPFFAQAGAEVPHLCFNGEDFDINSIVSLDDGRYCSEASWADLADHVAAIANQAGIKGLTIKGAQ